MWGASPWLLMRFHHHQVGVGEGGSQSRLGYKGSASLCDEGQHCRVGFWWKARFGPVPLSIFLHSFVLLCSTIGWCSGQALARRLKVPLSGDLAVSRTVSQIHFCSLSMPWSQILVNSHRKDWVFGALKHCGQLYLRVCCATKGAQTQLQKQGLD